ncbi:MAG: RNA polymerase sigma factor [Coriobacteriaceae bacterium]|nr:RNA polymerase sigma factor [Coriobacteriaceae bacterium]
MLGNEEMTRLYERHVKTVYRLCFSFLKSAHDAEDAVQNVFLKAMTASPDFASTEHEKAWLITCASNHCKDVLKSAYRTRTDFDAPQDSLADIPDRADVPKAFDRLYEALLALPQRYKECVYLYHYEGYRTDDIARLTGQKASTVRSHLSEARKILRQSLEGWEGGGEHGQ